MGPLLDDRSTYERSLGVKARIESGHSAYKAISPIDGLQVMDCNQALIEVGPEFGQDRARMKRVGYGAGRFFVREVVSHACPAQAAADPCGFVVRLGLNQYPLEIIPASEAPRRRSWFCWQDE